MFGSEKQTFRRHSYTRKYLDCQSCCHKKPTLFNSSSCSFSTVRVVVRVFQEYLSQDLRYHSYKLQIVQELKPSDHLMRQFCERSLAKMNEDNEFINNLWMSHEAHLHLNYLSVNTIFIIGPSKILLRYTSVRYTATRLPCGVLCHRMALQILIFFQNEDGLQTTVTSARYATMLETFVAQKLQTFPQTIENTWFQHDLIDVTHSTNIDGSCTPIVWQQFNFEKR